MPVPAPHRRPPPGWRALCLLSLLQGLLAGPAAAAVFDEVTARAAALAGRPPEAPPVAAPEASVANAAGRASTAEPTYDQSRDLRFKPERALWRERHLPFEVQFFHPGYQHGDTVTIHEVRPDGTQRTLPFDPSAFEAGPSAVGRPAAAGFAGLRVHCALNQPDYMDELIVFLGASYFRAVGGGQRYGLSARGLAIDSVGADREEFPRFTEFWLEQPAPGAQALAIDALLDSPSVAGAYRFIVTPGADTVVEVHARLFLRRTVHTLGLAPLTSMFLSGANQPRSGDFRPQVHDSDGLMVHSREGEWIWRPLVNPERPLATSFRMSGLAGFGLMQRDRQYADYEDDEARYELRPSGWIEPLGDWGPGRVELLQLPTPDETNDNIVAYWVPATAPVAGQRLDVAWRIHWQGGVQQRPSGAWTLQTRAGRSFAPLADTEQQRVVDFDGPALARLAADAPVRAVVTAVANADLTDTNVYRNPATGGWRLTLRYRPRDPAAPVELRAYLREGEHALTETWSHVIPPR